MRNAIPKAIAYSRNVRAIENHSFQAWLRQTIEREDLIAWARGEEPKPLRDFCLPSKMYEAVKAEPWWRTLTGIIP